MLPVNRKRNYFPEYNNFFRNRDFLSNFFSDGADYSVPAVNIKETESAFNLELAVPGLSKKDIRVALENNILSVSSSKETKNEKKVSDFTRKEFSYNSFNRSFELPENIDSDGIKASHKNGILNIEIPKVKEDKTNLSKSIKIS